MQLSQQLPLPLLTLKYKNNCLQLQKFEFIVGKEQECDRKLWKLCTGQKQLSTAENTLSNLSKLFQRQHANTELAVKNTWTHTGL